MSYEFNDIQAFHEKFGLRAPSQPQLPDEELFKFRLKFLKEEVNEFHEAFQENDLSKMADALIDLVYVAKGTAFMMGLPWNALWDEVHRANMRKERATHPSQSKRGSQLDVIKPAGWIGPDIPGVLTQAGADV